MITVRAGMWLYAGRETECGCMRGERPDVAVYGRETGVAVCGARDRSGCIGGERLDVAVYGARDRSGCMRGESPGLRPGLMGFDPFGVGVLLATSLFSGVRCRGDGRICRRIGSSP